MFQHPDGQVSASKTFTKTGYSRTRQVMENLSSRIQGVDRHVFLRNSNPIRNRPKIYNAEHYRTRSDPIELATPRFARANTVTTATQEMTNPKQTNRHSSPGHQHVKIKARTRPQPIEELIKRALPQIHGRAISERHWEVATERFLNRAPQEQTHSKTLTHPIGKYWADARWGLRGARERSEGERERHRGTERERERESGGDNRELCRWK